MYLVLYLSRNATPLSRNVTKPTFLSSSSNSYLFILFQLQCLSFSFFKGLLCLLYFRYVSQHKESGNQGIGGYWISLGLSTSWSETFWQLLVFWVTFFVSSNHITRRSGVYLEVPQRSAGLIDPHSLHNFYLRLSSEWNQRVETNVCENPLPQLSKVIFLTASIVTAAREDRYLALQSRQKKNERQSLCRSFLRLRRFVRARSNCFNHQATQATYHFACSGDTETFFIWIHDKDKAAMHVNYPQ